MYAYIRSRGEEATLHGKPASHFSAIGKSMSILSSFEQEKFSLSKQEALSLKALVLHAYFGNLTKMQGSTQRNIERLKYMKR